MQNETQLEGSTIRRSLASAVRILLSLALVAGAVAVILLGVFMGWGGKPAVRVEMSDNSAEVHVETIGEYPTTIVHARLENRRTHSTVWETNTNSGTPQLRAFPLKVGDNPALLASSPSGTYKVIVPVGVSSFRLERGVDYELDLWKSPDSSPARVKIRFDR